MPRPGTAANTTGGLTVTPIFWRIPRGRVCGAREGLRQLREQLHRGRKAAFLRGDQWAYTAGIVAVLVGATLVFLWFPKKDSEEALLAEYEAADREASIAVVEPGAGSPPRPAPA